MKSGDSSRWRGGKDRLPIAGSELSWATGDSSRWTTTDRRWQAQGQQGNLSVRVHVGRGGRSERFGVGKQARCAHSSTPELARRADGVHRSWTRIGLHFVKPSTNESTEWNGRTWTTSSWRCTRKSMFVDAVDSEIWQRRRWKVDGQSCASKTERREEIRQELRSPHLRNPTFLLSEGCENWKYGKTWPFRLEGSEADIHVSLCLRGGREVGTRRSLMGRGIDWAVENVAQLLHWQVFCGC